MNKFFKVVSNVAAVSKKIDIEIVNTLEMWGLLAERYAKQECPVDTGNLRNSISHKQDFGEKFAIVGTNVEYAPYVEFDDSKKHPTGKAHFLRDSIVTHGDEYKEIAIKHLGRV